MSEAPKVSIRRQRTPSFWFIVALALAIPLGMFAQGGGGGRGGGGRGAGAPAAVLRPFPVPLRRLEVLLLQPPLGKVAVQVVPVPRRRAVARPLLLSI